MTDKHSLDAVIVNKSNIFRQNVFKLHHQLRFYTIFTCTSVNMSCLDLMRLTVVDCNSEFILCSFFFIVLLLSCAAIIWRNKDLYIERGVTVSTR